jgi:hypothetical protein
MADPTKEAPTFETDDVKANRAMEQGLGVGARELAAQREPGGVNTADEDPEFENGVSVEAGDEEQLDENVSVQGLDNAG